MCVGSTGATVVVSAVTDDSVSAHSADVWRGTRIRARARARARISRTRARISRTRASAWARTRAGDRATDRSPLT